jgi:hypothetical protein
MDNLMQLQTRFEQEVRNFEVEIEQMKSDQVKKE